MTGARARVDAQVAWMAGAHRPSPQRADEGDGAAAEFVVNDVHVVVFAAYGESDTVLDAFEPGGRVLWSYTVGAGEVLDEVSRRVVTDLLDVMGREVRFPVETRRTRWSEHDPEVDWVME